jgi:hypothetical protein
MPLVLFDDEQHSYTLTPYLPRCALNAGLFPRPSRLPGLTVLLHFACFPFDRRHFENPGAISLCFPDSPYSHSPFSYLNRNDPDSITFTFLVLLPHPSP